MPHSNTLSIRDLTQTHSSGLLPCWFSIGSLSWLAVAALCVQVVRTLVLEAGEPPAQAFITDADWLEQTAPASVESGWIHLRVQPEERTLQGLMILIGTRAENGLLHAVLPPGVERVKTSVQCRETPSRIEGNRLVIQVGECPVQGCIVDIDWTLDIETWNPDASTSWVDSNGYRLRAADVMPRLGLDIHRIAHSPDRPYPGQEPILPPSSPALENNWRWIVRLDGVETEQTVRRGKIRAPLDFADAWMPRIEHAELEALETLRESGRQWLSSL